MKTRKSIHVWLRAVVLWALACGPLACAHRLEAARWQPVTVPGVCKVTLEPYGSVLSYDASGRLLSAVTASRDAADATSRHWPWEDWEQFRYDAQGRLTEVLSGKQEGGPGGENGEFLYGVRELVRVRFFYDAQGKLVREESCTDTFHQEPRKSASWRSPYGRCSPSVTEYTYDEAGRPAAMTHRGKTARRWVYEAGRPVAVHTWYERVYLTYDASGFVVEVRKEACTDGQDCQPASTSRYMYDVVTGRLVEEVRDIWNDRSRIQSYFRWEYPSREEPSFKLTDRSTSKQYGYGTQPREPELVNHLQQVMEVTYEKGRLARISSRNIGRSFTYEGACENVRVADEHYFTPDVPGSLNAAPCFRSPRGYYSTCVATW